MPTTSHASGMTTRDPGDIPSGSMGQHTVTPPATHTSSAASSGPPAQSTNAKIQEQVNEVISDLAKKMHGKDISIVAVEP